MTKPHITTTKGRASSKRISFIIPTAGIGRRMKSYGPKSLLNIKPNLPLLNYQIKQIKSCYPESEIIVVVGFESHKLFGIIPPEVRVVENENYESTNIVRSISFGIRASIYDNIFIVPGDMAFNKNTILNVDVNKSFAIIDKNDEMCKEIVGINYTNNKVLHFSFGLNIKWSTLAYLTQKEAIEFRKYIHDKKNMNCYMYEILNTIIDRGGQINAEFPQEMQILKIHNPKDVTTLQSIKW